MSQTATIRVNVPDRPYTISVGPGLLSRAGSWLRQICPSPKAAVVTDSNVGPLHGQTLSESLASAGFETTLAVIPAGECNKNLAHVLPVYDALLAAKMERNTPLLALGGGVVGDMAGFVAATILRGVPLVQIPTSLLAMVDASIGGKTGVDHALGKNLIGAFHQPIAVLIDPQTLRSLPPREFGSGLAECVKHELIRDAAGFAALERQMDHVKALEMDAVAELIAHNVAIKARVVEADPLEKGERAHLNFGHTFGHAIESVSGYSYSHGEAISLGMTAAAYVSCKLGLIDQTSRRRILALLDRAGLPTTGLKLDVQQVLDAMHFDKKVRHGRIRLVLLARMGAATIRDDVPPTLLRQALESLRE